MTSFLTIKQTAKEFRISENALRGMQKRGELPGFFSGSRFYVHAEMLMEKLDSLSRENGKKEQAV